MLRVDLRASVLTVLGRLVCPPDVEYLGLGLSCSEATSCGLQPVEIQELNMLTQTLSRDTHAPYTYTRRQHCKQDVISKGIHAPRALVSNTASNI